MKYNQLGTSDLEVSAIGFGTMSLDVMNTKESENLLKFAFDQGVNYFDTADLYNRGENEIMIGKLVKSFRKKIVLATKVGNRWKDDNTGWNWDVSSTYIKQAVDQSLLRLQTDYIDLYQIHGGTIEDNFEDILGTLEELVALGKIRYYGISSIRPNVFSRFCKASNIISNMMQYSVLDNRPEEYFSVFEESKKSIIARGALAQGLLVNKEPKAYLDFSRDQVLAIQRKIEHFCENEGISTIAFALKYVLDKAIVASALVGFRNSEQLEDVLHAFETLENVCIDFDALNLDLMRYRDHVM